MKLVIAYIQPHRLPDDVREELDVYVKDAFKSLEEA